MDLNAHFKIAKTHCTARKRTGILKKHPSMMQFYPGSLLLKTKYNLQKKINTYFLHSLIRKNVKLHNLVSKSNMSCSCQKTQSNLNFFNYSICKNYFIVNRWVDSEKSDEKDSEPTCSKQYSHFTLKSAHKNLPAPQLPFLQFNTEKNFNFGTVPDSKPASLLI